MADATNTLPSTDNTSLTCAARVLGYECADANIEFMRCKQNNADPRACLPQGEKVTACVMKTLREVETHCGDTYAAYKKALKKNWHQIDEVRKEQAAFESCWREFKQYNKINQQKQERQRENAPSSQPASQQLFAIPHNQPQVSQAAKWTESTIKTICFFSDVKDLGVHSLILVSTLTLLFLRRGEREKEREREHNAGFGV